MQKHRTRTYSGRRIGLVKMGLGGGGHAPTGLLTSLVAYWKLDEASGTRVDSIAGNNLTDHNSTLAAAGKIGNAASFVEASSQYLSSADVAVLRGGAGSWTIQAWARATTLSAADHNIVVKGAADYTPYALYTKSGTNTIDFFVSDFNYDHFEEVVGPALSTGTWYHLLAWYDSGASTLNVQVNAGTVTSVPITFTPFDDGSENAGVEVGGSSGGGYWDGLVDEVAKWNRVLTAFERAALYNGGAGLPLTSF